MIEASLLLLLLLQLKHFVCDFVTQTPYQLRYKGIYGHPAGLLHVGQHAVGTAIVLAALNVATPLSTPAGLVAALLAAEALLHYHIDWGKEQLIKPFVKEQGAAYWAIFGFDQFLHQASYIAMAYVLVRV
jgi:hypothetical protein